MHQAKQGKSLSTPLSGFLRNHSRKPSLSTPKKPFNKYYGPVYVLAEVYKLLSPEAVAALKKYNTEPINKFAKRRGIYVTDMNDHESPPSEDTTHEEQPDPHQFEDAPENEIDPILDYINSQHYHEDDMNNAFQASNAMISSTPDDTSQWSINSVHTHIFYHVAQAKQVQHGQLVDRGANGGLAGSDVTIL